MEFFCYPLFTVCNVVLLASQMQRFLKERSTVTTLLIIEFLGLTFDAGMICSGTWLEAGPLLESLSQPRFVLHALLTPLSIMICLELLIAGGAYRLHRLRPWGWVLTLGMVSWGLWDVQELVLAPVQVGGVLYYTYAVPPGPPIPAIVTIMVALMCGGALWQQRQWPWLCVGAIVILVGYGVLARMLGMVVGYGSEQLFMISLVATQYWLFKPEESLPSGLLGKRS